MSGPKVCGVLAHCQNVGKHYVFHDCLRLDDRLQLSSMICPVERLLKPRPSYQRSQEGHTSGEGKHPQAVGTGSCGMQSRDKKGGRSIAVGQLRGQCIYFPTAVDELTVHVNLLASSRARRAVRGKGV